jgi:AcrR family transcriptional regulator
VTATLTPTLTPTPTPLACVARPKQARSEQTLYRILEAAEALIHEKGLADVSIPEIVRRADSSVGGFYARFRDKDELLRALQERFLNGLSERVEELADPTHWGDASTAQIVRSCMAELVSTFRARRNLLVAFMARAARDRESREEGLRFRRKVSARISELLLTRRDELAHLQPEIAIDLGVQLAFGLMFQSVIFGEPRAAGRPLEDAAIERELTRNFLAYVGIVSVERVSDLERVPDAAAAGALG